MAVENEEVSENNEATEADGFSSVENDAVDSDLKQDEDPDQVSESEQAENQDEAQEEANKQADSEEDAIAGEMDEIQKELDELNSKPVPKAELDQAIRRIDGRFGEVISRLKKLESRKPKFNPEKLRATTENFDEDYAQAHAQELNEAFEYEEPEVVDDYLEPSAEEKLEAMTALGGMHKDYLQVFQSQAYDFWLKTLPADVEQSIRSSWDAEYLGRAITEFKQYHAARMEAMQKQQRKQQRQQQKSERLRSSVQIQGNAEAVNGAGLTEADGFASVEMN